LVSEAGFIAAQDATAPRGQPARPPGSTCWPDGWSAAAAGGGWNQP